MHKNKKGAEMSINEIIIAIFALVVLAVLIYIFSGRSQLFVKSVSPSCESKEGTCKESCDKDTEYVTYVSRCKDSDEISKELKKCCIPFK